MKFADLPGYLHALHEAGWETDLGRGAKAVVINGDICLMARAPGSGTWEPYNLDLLAEEAQRLVKHSTA